MRAANIKKHTRSTKRAILFRGDNVELHYGMATVCFLLDDLPSALEHFNEVIRLDPTRANAHINLGAVHDRMGHYQESLAALKRGIQLDPTRPEGAYNLALVYKHHGDLERAIGAYRDAIRINPNMYDAHYNLGNVLLEKHEAAQAIVEYRRALEVRPGCELALGALEVARAALDSANDGEAPVAEEPSPAAAAAPPIDLDRAIDPAVHLHQLRDLHMFVIDVNNHGTALLDFLKHHVEEAIRAMTICILSTKDSKLNLDDQILEFEAVMAKLKQMNFMLMRQMGAGQDNESGTAERVK